MLNKKVEKTTLTQSKSKLLVVYKLDMIFYCISFK